MDDSDPFATASRFPAPGRPLLGVTILVVEDSRLACDAIRLMCLRSGARIRRADCLHSARRHLRVYRPTAMIVDLGLPDGSGLDLIADLTQATPRVDVLLATSGDDALADAAIAAGADGFLTKPIRSLATFQTAILSRLPPERCPPGPGPLIDEEVAPDPVAFRDDMAHAADVLTDLNDAKTLDYVAQFVRGVARSAADAPLAMAAEALTQARAEGRPFGADAARFAGMVQDRLGQRQAIR